MTRLDSIPVYCSTPPCRDTLTGWLPFGPDQGKTPYIGSHFVEVKTLGRTLFARNTQGDIYFRALEKKEWWRKLDLGEKAANKEAMFVEGQTLYLLTLSGKILTLDTRGNRSFVEQVPDSLTCQLPGTSQCTVRDIYRYKGQFFIEAAQPYLDSTFLIFKDSLFNYHLLLGQNSAWQRMRWQGGLHPQLNLSFRNFWLHGDSILGATYEHGIWIYNGEYWDSIAKPRAAEHGDSDGVNSIIYWKWGGVAVLQGTIYASPWSGGLYRLEGKELKKITLKTVTNKKDTILWDGYFNWGLDTLCGHLIDNHGMVRWKPEMLGWKEMVDTTQAYAVRGFYYSISDAFSMTRVGDSLFAAYQAPIDLKKDSIPGGIAMLNLRDTPWCEEAWKRGEADRASKRK